MNSDKFNQSEIIPGTNWPTNISTSISSCHGEVTDGE